MMVTVTPKPIPKPTANCKLCKQIPQPTDYLSPRLCAFDRRGNFTRENWNCETANALRQACGEDLGSKGSEESLYVRRSDQSYAAIYIPPNPEDVPDGDMVGPFRGGGFIAMSWYKSHGQVDAMIRVDPRDGGMWDRAGLPLTRREAEAALENLKLARRTSSPS